MTRLDIYFDFLLILLSEKPSALFDFTNPDWAPTLNLTAYQRLFGGESNITPGGKVFTAILRDFLGKGE